MTINKFKLFVSLILGLALLPVVAFARLEASTSAQVKLGVQANASANFCTNLNTFTNQLTDRLSNTAKNLSSHQEERLSQVSKRQTQRAQQLADLRTKADLERQAIYAQLTAKAVTDVQKQAVLNFQTTMQAAVSLRRSEVDVAIADYWKGLKDILSKRQAAVQTAEQNFDSTLQAALNKAQMECSAGTAEARAHFVASLSSARIKFVSDRKAIDKYGPQISALVQTRNAAKKKAMDNFKKTAEKARVDLKAAFGAKAETINP